MPFLNITPTTTASATQLLSQLAESGNELNFAVHGVCALLLGICIIENDGTVQQFTKYVAPLW